jgi:hypothetical protein
MEEERMSSQKISKTTKARGNKRSTQEINNQDK